MNGFGGEKKHLLGVTIRGNGLISATDGLRLFASSHHRDDEFELLRFAL